MLSYRKQFLICYSFPRQSHHLSSAACDAYFSCRENARTCFSKASPSRPTQWSNIRFTISALHATYTHLLGWNSSASFAFFFELSMAIKGCYRIATQRESAVAFTYMRVCFLMLSCLKSRRSANSAQIVFPDPVGAQISTLSSDSNNVVYVCVWIALKCRNSEYLDKHRLTNFYHICRKTYML
jgi:hypothetical protein